MKLDKRGILGCKRYWICRVSLLCVHNTPSLKKPAHEVSLKLELERRRMLTHLRLSKSLEYLSDENFEDRLLSRDTFSKSYFIILQNLEIFTDAEANRLIYRWNDYKDILSFICRSQIQNNSYRSFTPVTLLLTSLQWKPWRVLRILTRYSLNWCMIKIVMSTVNYSDLKEWIFLGYQWGYNSYHKNLGWCPTTGGFNQIKTHKLGPRISWHCPFICRGLTPCSWCWSTWRRSLLAGG